MVQSALLRIAVDTALALEIAFLVYFVVINLTYFGMTAVAFVAFLRDAHVTAKPDGPDAFSDFEVPITILVPAYNEAAIIEIGVRSLLALHYSTFEVIVINDGSKDDTVEILKREFALEPIPDASERKLETVVPRGVYRSRTHANLRLIDKPNGGKSDALNAGLNLARYPLVFCADADSSYLTSCLRLMVQPFLDDPTTIVSGGNVAIRSAEFERGKPIVKTGLPKLTISRFQVVEYLRSFLSSRMAWSQVNALMIISGACGLWKKDVLIESGGFRTDTIWEDMEITFRLHHDMRAKRRPYRIAFVPQTVCLTDVPEDIKTLFNQRAGWHRHLSECISIHRRMLFNPRYGSVGMLAYPYLVFGEWLAPVILIFGLGFTIVMALTGLLSGRAQLILLFLVFAFGYLNSVSALLLDTIAFRSFKPREVVQLLGYAAIEMFGYRQLATWANFVGFWRWLVVHPIRGKREGVANVKVQAYRPFEK